MRRALSTKQMVMAYLLNQDPDLGHISTQKIAELFGVAQSTVWNAVREIAIQIQIKNLQQELESCKQELLASEKIKKLVLTSAKRPVFCFAEKKK